MCIDRIIKREAHKNETKKQRRCGRRNEGRRMPQGRNEEIRKGGIGIGKKKKKKGRKRMRRKKRGQRTTGESIYGDIRCKVQER